MASSIQRPGVRPQSVRPQRRPVVDDSSAAKHKSHQISSPSDKLVHGKPPALTGQSPATGKLEDSPQFKASYARASQSDRNLLDEIKDKPHSHNAFQTYQGLRSGVQNPARLTDSMVRDMVVGVADSRGTAHASPEGLLSQAHVENAKSALFNMKQEHYDKFKSSYQNAGGGGSGGNGAEAYQAQSGSSPLVERQLLMKSLGARRSQFRSDDPKLADKAMAEIQNFGNTIQGVPAETVKRATTLLKTDFDPKGYTQGQHGTCAAATNLMMKGENDPILGMKLRQNAADEPGLNKQAEIDLVESQGEVATEGMSDESITAMHNSSGVDSQLTYAGQYYGGKGGIGKDINKIAELVGKGDDVPIGVNFGTDAEGKSLGGHAMHISAVDGEPGNRMFTVHDTNSYSGKTLQIPEKDLVDGTFMTKHFGYPEQFRQAWIETADLPTRQQQVDPMNLGIVNQQQVDQGLVNASMEQKGQHLPQGSKAQPAEQEQAQQPVYNPDLDDGIPIKDDFGIEDDF